MSNGIRRARRIEVTALITRRIAIAITLATLVAGGALLNPLRASAASEIQVTAAASAAFPADTTFSGIPVTRATFGLGVVVDPSGSGSGDFEIVLQGTSPLGQAQDITLVGKVSAGLSNDDGSVSLSGSATLDMGDGALPLTVPFALVVTASGLGLTIDTTALPALTLTEGSIYYGS
jgi:hypothetical protein